MVNNEFTELMSVWFSTNFPEANNNKLRIFYLETRISSHQFNSPNIEYPFDIINTLINSLLIILLIHSFIEYLNNLYNYLYNKYLYLTQKSINKTPINQSIINWIVLQFLIKLFSIPKKTSKWNL